MSFRGWFPDDLEAFCDIFSRLVVVLFRGFVPNGDELFVEVMVLARDVDGDSFSIFIAIMEVVLPLFEFVFGPPDLDLGELEVLLVMSLSGEVYGLGATCYMLSMDQKASIDYSGFKKSLMHAQIDVLRNLPNIRFRLASFSLCFIRFYL
ncbi:hypothetical protein TIFTF001_025814 [Ficus carica]|uniref:Uncharacterized protein n=1 Tax=Ficus carica TaxID=3494 RepID=A0AA88AKI8_FICCA|nr:hypothetical protein TIFTF001_025814 [Ficus carica]